MPGCTAGVGLAAGEGAIDRVISVNDFYHPIVPLAREELPVDTVELARFMVGKCLVHDCALGRLSGRIVETEAYPLGDSTNHAYRGLRPYNRALFRVPGHAYVRLVYGACYMINLSAEPEGKGAAVLLRAVEPLDGIPLMHARRPGAKLVDLARGPGRLCAAFGIGPEADGADLCGRGALWLEHSGLIIYRVAASCRSRIPALAPGREGYRKYRSICTCPRRTSGASTRRGYG